MRKKSLLCIWVILLLHATPVFGEDGYLCAADMANGFSYNSEKQSWEHTKFVVEALRFEISKVDASGVNFELKKLGATAPLCLCNNCFAGDTAFFECRDGEFRFNKKTGRFLNTWSAGYIDGDNPEFTPFVAVGKCSPLK